MSKDTAQLLIFNTFNEDPVIKSYSAAKQIDNNEAWCDFFSALVEKGEEIGLSGRLFSSYVIYSLTKGDNIIADNIQHNGNIGKSLELLLKADMEIIYPYLQNELQGSSDIFKILNNYEPSHECVIEAYKELLSAFAKTESAAEAADCLIRHYKKFGSGKMAHYRAFRWHSSKKLVGIEHFEKIRMSDLIGYKRQKKMLIDNTIAFIDNKPANNILLVGARGTGKSSGVKALANEYYKKGLRLLQITRDQMKTLPEIMEYLRELAGYKFIIFLDDLSFSESETEYKYLKSVIEGGVSALPRNVLIYATSNRRHIIKETWNDREDTQDELYRNDSINESISLSDRFGIIITYDAPDQDEYLAIIDHYLQKEGIELNADQLRIEGLRWELTHSGRSGRVARQFVNWYLGTH